MTNAQKKVNDAREAFQKEMDVWGLTVEHGSSCHYVVGAKAVTFSTVARPAKGRKKLIEDLRGAGYEVWTFKAEDKDGKRYMKFRAYKTVKIKTAADDAEEYVEQPTEVKQKNDDVNEIYRKNEFAVQVVAKGSFLDSDPGYGGKVYEVETATIRLNHVAMNEWIFTQVTNDRECYDTDEEWKQYLDEKKKRAEEFDRKIADALGFDTSVASVRVSQVVSEVFGVAYISEKKV